MHQNQKRINSEEMKSVTRTATVAMIQTARESGRSKRQKFGKEQRRTGKQRATMKVMMAVITRVVMVKDHQE